VTAPKLKLVVSSDIKQLLQSAAEGFLRPLHATPNGPFPTPGYLLALRQGGIRDDVIRLSAQHGCKGWFDPPLCIFHELPKWLGEPATQPLGDIERLALLGNVIRSVGGDVFGRSNNVEYFLNSLDGLFGELVSEGITPSDFEELTSVLGSEEGSFDARKNAELVKIFTSYKDGLEAAGVGDGRDNLVAMADVISRDAEGLATRLGGRREIRFFGLADLRGGWRKLLRALVESASIDSIRLYAAREFSRVELDALPRIEIEHLSTGRSVAASLFRDTDDAAPGGDSAQFSVCEAPNPERELGEVALRIRQLVDARVPPHRIAVVARRGRPYVELVVRALSVVGLPAAARIRIAFDEIPVVKSVLNIFSAASDGWTRSNLAELAGLPHVKPLLDSVVLNFIGFRRCVRGLHSWETALENLLSEARSSLGANSDGERGWTGPPVDRIESALGGFREVRKLLSELDRARHLLEWIEWLESFLDSDPLQIENRIYNVPDTGYDQVRKDLAGWRGLQNIIREWKEAVSKWGDIYVSDPADNATISVAEFSGRLREMLDGQIGIWTDSHRGVRVLEALAAAYREFDHLFLVGMEAGAFPLPAQCSPILDDDDRCTMRHGCFRLDTREDWDTRERELFRTVVAAGKHLTVSYPAIGVRGAESIRSSFVEALADVAVEDRLEIDSYAVHTPDTPLVSSAKGRARAGHAAHTEYARMNGAESPFNGVILDSILRNGLAEQYDDNKMWSPSQIEEYAKCPWAYFSGRLLNVQKFDDPDEDMDAPVRGSLLHAALARFYDRVGEERGRPVFLRSSDLDWAVVLMEETLDAAFEEMQESVWMGHPVLRETKRGELKRELCRYLAWEVDFHDRMENPKKSDITILRTGAEIHELSFGRSGDIVLERNGVRFKFRGFIDRVDRGIDPRVEDPSRFVAAIDYKSSMSGVPGGGKKDAWDEGVVLQVPLYAYALTQLRDDAVVSRVEYHPLRQTKPGATPGTARPHCLQLYQVDKKTGVLKENEQDAAKMERALACVSEHVLNLRQGRFLISPAPSCGCPSYCHAYDICRVTERKRMGKKR